MKEIMNFTLHQGDNRDILKTLKDNSVDAIVTDPPYGINFLGKDWDADTGTLETYIECLRVLKPGGHILAFSAARTYHHLAIVIEQAGFEIRDQLMWLYASGFPKGHDLGKAIQKKQGVEQTKEKELIMQGGFTNWSNSTEDKTSKKHNETIKEVIPTSPEALQWAGWKTALKPAHEPIVMARKPMEGNTIDNVTKYGVGAINVDDNRIPYVDNKDKESASGFKGKQGSTVFDNFSAENTEKHYNNDGVLGTPDDKGRYASNVIGEVTDYQKYFYNPPADDVKDYVPYFYCPKVSRKERHVGFDDDKVIKNLGQMYGEEQHVTRSNNKTPLNTGNNHPTVKPVALMSYLINLVAPKNSVILDPFCGSGSTGMAAVALGHTFIGCELDPNYVAIATQRIEAWNKPTHFDNLFENNA